MTYVVLDGSGTVTTKNNAKTFADLPEESWYKSAVDFASSHELLAGTSANTFSPNISMNRAMMVTALWSLQSKELPTADKLFDDIPDGARFSESVAWAAERGIVAGYDDGSYKPYAALTREQMILMLYRYAESLDMDVSTDESLDKFADAALVSPWTKDAMEWAVSAGLITGVDVTHLNPCDTATRAQAAVVLQHFVRMIVK